jgi:uncharacterized protein (DUF2336 family)
VSFSDFRRIEGSGERQDRLLRAAISAFCSIPRPSRREIAQIEDLAMPLLDAAAPETRRFVAAALSECCYPPADLVRRLTKEPVDIAAPLLVRSEALSDADLIALIARQGLQHAQAIAKRPKLSPKVAALIEKLAREGEETPSRQIAPRPEERQPAIDAGNKTQPATGAGNKTPPAIDAGKGIRPAAAPRDRSAPGAAAEEVRGKLRQMVRDYEERTGHHRPLPDPEAADRVYGKLEASVLAGNAAFFQTALADALGLSFAAARSLIEAQGYTDLMVALRALDLDDARAFLLVSAAFPSTFNHADAVRLFLERYRLLHRDAAIGQVRRWTTAPLGDDTRSGLVPLPKRRVTR